MSRCLLVSNRLPYHVDPQTETLSPTHGGLSSALRGLDTTQLGFEFIWYGLTTKSWPSHLCSKNIRPILMDESLYQSYYSDYCNSVLWPLLHSERAAIQDSKIPWESYLRINYLMAEHLLNETHDDDLIWIHDYHFFLLPKLIKERRPALKVAFFLHTPFPHHDLFRELPEREVILSSLHASDLVGFQDLSYLKSFKLASRHILNTQPPCQSSVYPISINVESFRKLAHETETKRIVKSCLSAKGHKKWILGIDRLDTIKGLKLKLMAFERLLETYPELIKNVQLLQVVIPSRMDSPVAQQLKLEIEEHVHRINAKYESHDYLPVLYRFGTLTPNELSALYQNGDVMFIPSLRDGMNLVGLEYMASQSEHSPGVVLLSEFAGAHSQLMSAIGLNPWNLDEMVLKLASALNLALNVRQQRFADEIKFLSLHDSHAWAKSMLEDLQSLHHAPPPLPIEVKTWTALKGKKTVLFCDFDGTLAPLSKHPDFTSIPVETEKLLKSLVRHPDLTVVIISGRDENFLMDTFIKNGLSFHLGASHGALHYCPLQQYWQPLATESPHWKNELIPLLSQVKERVPGSFIEDKGQSLTWHFPETRDGFAQRLARKFIEETEIPNCKMLSGHQSLEIRPSSISKGLFIQNWLNTQEYLPDVVMAIGDDQSDEDMFHYLKNQSETLSFTVKVGVTPTCAEYCIKDQKDVHEFLKNLTDSL